MQTCDPKKLHLALLGLYERTEQPMLADALLDKMTKKFKKSFKVINPSILGYVWHGCVTLVCERSRAKSFGVVLFLHSCRSFVHHTPDLVFGGASVAIAWISYSAM